MKKDTNWNKLNEEKGKLKLFGFQCAPGYSTSERLMRFFSDIIYREFDDVNEIEKSEIADEVIVRMITKQRHDYLKLEAVLKIYDSHFKVSSLPVFKERLNQMISDEEIKQILNSKDNTVDFIRSTISIDTLIQICENKYVYSQKKSIREFSELIKEMIKELYSIKDTHKISA